MNLPSFPTAGVLKIVDFSRFQTVIAPAGAIVVSILVLLFVIWPKFGQSLKLRAENEQLASRNSLLDAKVSVLEALDKDLLDLQLVAAERLLPSDKSVFAFVSQVENSASASGVVLTKVDVAPGAVSPGAQPAAGAAPTPAAAAGANAGEPSDATKVQVKVSLTSDYKSLVNFIERIVTLSRVAAVKDITVASTSATSGSAPLRSTLVIDAYWRVLPKELGSVEAPVSELTEDESKVLDRVRKLVVSEPISLPSAPAPVAGGRSDLFAPF